MNANTQRVLNLLESVSSAGDNQWMARCPAHGDDKPSLAVSIGDKGQTFLYCHAGCNTNSEVLPALGLKWADLFLPEDDGRKIVAAYDYKVENGQLIYQVVRSDPKGFFQRRPDGQGGWINNLKGVRRVLYRLPELLASKPKPVFIVEGEKDVERLVSMGFVATTNPGGASKGHEKSKWQDSYNPSLAGRSVVILPDNDEAGRNHAQQVARSLNGTAQAIKILELPDLPEKGDVSDWLDAGGTRDKLIELVKSAPTWTPPKDGNKTTRVAKAEQQVNRPGTKIVIDVDEHRVNDAAVDAIANEPSIYQRGSVLVHVVRDATLAEGSCDAAPPRITQVPLALLRDRLTAVVRFVKLEETKEGWEEFPCHPPDWCVKAVAARGNWPKIRPLRGLVTAPVLKPNGTVLDVPGYDVASGLLYESDGQSYSIPQSPSQDEAKKAVDSINRLVTDFPFAKAEHRSAFLAALLTPLARFAFNGPAPLFLFDANVRSSGKSLLVDLISWIVTGRPMPRMPNSDDDAEMRKRIMALALGGDQLVLLDNIGATLGCPSLDAALTGTSWKDRILGKSEVTELPLSATWYASGNNVMLAADTSRRVLHIRLDSPHERPELREGFAVADIRKHVRQQRAEYLSAGLTILRAYFVAGSPKGSLPSWGSFEGWSDLVRQAIVWCGEPDPGLTREEFIESADTERNSLRELLHGWGELDADCVGVTTSAILTHLATFQMSCQAVREAVLELCPAPAGKLPSSRSLGRKLRSLIGRVVDGRFLDAKEDRNGSLVWRVRQAEAKPTYQPQQFNFPEGDVRGLQGQQNLDPAHNPAGQVVADPDVRCDAEFAGSVSSP